MILACWSGCRGSASTLAGTCPGPGTGSATSSTRNSQLLIDAVRIPARSTQPGCVQRFAAADRQTAEQHGVVGGTGGKSNMIGHGDLVPDVALVDHEGDPWRFSDHRGRPLLLVLHRHLA